MEENFIPYEEAVALHKLGFNESCFAFFNGKYHDWLIDDNKGLDPPTINPNMDIESCIKRPTFSQAFNFFRDKYNIDSYISPCYDYEKKSYKWTIIYENLSGEEKSIEGWTYAEAELNLLKTLIENN